MYSNFSVYLVVRPNFLGRYFNAFNKIDNKNSMSQSDLALEKHWVTHGGYFRLATTVVLCIGITDGNLLYRNGVSEGNVDKQFSTM